MIGEKPIPFTTTEVQAILDGRKTMMRQIIKPQPNFVECDLSKIYKVENLKQVEIEPPYQPGDILLVGENWYYEEHLHDLTSGEPDLPGGRYSHRYVYEASDPDYPVDIGVGEHGWRPSSKMPRSAARLFLKVKNVHVERLQDITENDVRREGFRDSFDPLSDIFYPSGYHFVETWNSLNAKRGYGWNVNPWVWVIELENNRPISTTN